ncbi:NADH dehydrogenase [ubiquinone] 1 beta subcomplex subunit 9 [Eurytemora carolleeae]|uniref:NADH dehydrogenase [ubiquinone] 1 beta subcomplex subunit 9 n=1 Tax=Eurytemora carolleeae TaxID=1294199 RepID=UPI000C76A331|nr:NADH dehydrogenase [ubiquinone] 1 beta subcomplex subunit 9 [Eurytemora carolleeae]|eukprot:XP_023332794.1 NADH dehydrogenase [ubiquinone] 1 beta subcomplex subunit 9-like [Eurytemora affinis]
MSGPKEILTHAQKVCRLYKAALRSTENWTLGKAEHRFNATVLRARFDETRNEKDMRVNAARLEEAKHELWEKQHSDPIIFKNDAGGICYRREHTHLDYLFDQYHPWEKVMMRDFFERRETLKKEYEEYFEKSLTKKYQTEPLVV